MAIWVNQALGPDSGPNPPTLNLNPGWAWVGPGQSCCLKAHPQLVKTLDSEPVLEDSNTDSTQKPLKWSTGSCLSSWTDSKLPNFICSTTHWVQLSQVGSSRGLKPCSKTMEKWPIKDEEGKVFFFFERWEKIQINSSEDSNVGSYNTHRFLL